MDKCLPDEKAFGHAAMYQTCPKYITDLKSKCFFQILWTTLLDQLKYSDKTNVTQHMSVSDTQTKNPSKHIGTDQCILFTQNHQNVCPLIQPPCL